MLKYDVDIIDVGTIRDWDGDGGDARLHDETNDVVTDSVVVSEAAARRQRIAEAGAARLQVYDWEEGRERDARAGERSAG